MNNYSLLTYHANRDKKTILTVKQMKEIEKRKLHALKMNNYSDILDAKTKVLTIIDEKGLENDDDKVKLKTAMDLLEYIIPKKKSTETTIITRKLEDIIADHIQEAEIIEQEDETNPPSNKP